MSVLRWFHRGRPASVEERCPMFNCDGIEVDGSCGIGRGVTPCTGCGHPVCQHTLFSKHGVPCRVSGCDCRQYEDES